MAILIIVAPCTELFVASCQTSKAATQDDLQRYYLFPSMRCKYGFGAHCERYYIHAAPRQGPPAPRSQGVISASVVVAPG